MNNVELFHKLTLLLEDESLKLHLLYQKMQKVAAKLKENFSQDEISKDKLLLEIKKRNQTFIAKIYKV
ncbi:hypothetical protein UXU46_02935 [Campylobacter jejuni]